MPDTLAPILHVKDGLQTSEWYARLGFEVMFKHRFTPGMPLYLVLKRGDLALHLSEHLGDAQPGTLVYLSTGDVDSIALAFGVAAIDQPWGREVQLTDPDGNRWRIGRPNR